MYLLDTMTVSAIRTRGYPDVLAWVATVDVNDLYLSVLTVGEIEHGARQLSKKNPTGSVALDDWLDVVLAVYGERILPVTVAIARRWGSLSQTIGNTTFDLGIAATALEHKLTVATRNIKHFVPTGVRIFDPFTGKQH